MKGIVYAFQYVNAWAYMTHAYTTVSCLLLFFMNTFGLKRNKKVRSHSVHEAQEI